MSRGPRRNPGWVTPPPDFPDPLVGLADHPAPLPLEEVFGRRAPLEVEIGSGKGNTLVQLASERPDVDYLGIEIGVKWVRLSRARLIRAGLAKHKHGGSNYKSLADLAGSPLTDLDLNKMVVNMAMRRAAMKWR